MAHEARAPRHTHRSCGVSDHHSGDRADLAEVVRRFKVDEYLAALYLERRSRDGSAIANSEQIKLMRLRFVRDVGRAEIGQAIRTRFEQSEGPAFAKLKSRVDRLTASLPELKNGDTLTLVYRPGQGVEVSHSKRRLVSIPGADFGSALFRVWLGDHPANESLKRGLLGGSCG